MLLGPSTHQLPQPKMYYTNRQTFHNSQSPNPSSHIPPIQCPSPTSCSPSLILLQTNLEAHGPGWVNTVAQFLNPQNAVRRQVGLPPLRWSKPLANYARWYGNQRRADCALVHSDSSYGENLFWGRGKQWKIADAIGAWVSEKSYYDHKNNVCYGNTDCLHYTQIVWKATKRVGCARVACTSGDTYFVCEYDPYGNIVGQRPY